MKKAFLALLGFAAFTLSAQAQAQNTTTENRKATTRNIALEANLNPFNGGISLSNSLNQIKGRYFLSDDMAVRLGVHVGYQNLTIENINDIRKSERNLFDFSINPGIEKHFAGTERLSPYVGAELSLQNRSSSATVTYQNGNISEIKGTWDGGGPVGFINIGLNGLAGFDYYLGKNFFVGYELGLGLKFGKDKDVEITNNGNTTTFEGHRYTTFAPYVLNGIRVGFVLK